MFENALRYVLKKSILLTNVQRQQRTITLGGSPKRRLYSRVN
jgi:hypothetical protein